MFEEGTNYHNLIGGDILILHCKMIPGYSYEFQLDRLQIDLP